MQTYRIIPAVTNAGVPTWRLYRDAVVATPFGVASGTSLLAQNEDKRVLEGAVEHLTKARIGQLESLPSGGLRG